MSYSFSPPCSRCIKEKQCTDRAVISGAISGIHQMPFGVGHLGSGTIELKCSNIQQPEPKQEP